MDTGRAGRHHSRRQAVRRQGRSNCWSGTLHCDPATSLKTQCLLEGSNVSVKFRWFFWLVLTLVLSHADSLSS